MEPTGNAKCGSDDLHDAASSKLGPDPCHAPPRRAHGRTVTALRQVVRGFTPSWFSVNMGTGIVSILLFRLPYNGDWLYWLSIVVFVLNVALFILFFFISVLRYTLWPAILPAMMRHPMQSLFLGTFPMGLSTIVTMVVLVCVPAWGAPAVTLAWALWWIDTALSIGISCYLPFVIMSVHKTELSKMTAVWLLPIASTVVAAGVGAIVAGVLPRPDHALWTLILSFVMWGMGMPLALAILVIYFQRLTIHKLPPRELLVSVFLPLGPVGMGGFAIMQLGRVARAVLPATQSVQTPGALAGDVLYVVGWALGLILWGFGIVWLFFAVASISQCKFPFNMGWWGFTFPLGVYALSTTTLGQETSSVFFNVLGTIFSVAVILLWLMVFALTAVQAAKGDIFLAPCHREAEQAEAKKTPEVAVAAKEKV